MMIRRAIASIAAALLLCACLCVFSGCSSDSNDFVGEWKIQDKEVTVVFTGSKFKLVGSMFDYSLDTSNKTITYKSGEATGTSKYTFSPDKNVLTLEETDGNNTVKVTVFEKISNNANAEPTVNISIPAYEPEPEDDIDIDIDEEPAVDPEPVDEGEPNLGEEPEPEPGDDEPAGEDEQEEE